MGDTTLSPLTNTNTHTIRTQLRTQVLQVKLKDGNGWIEAGRTPEGTVSFLGRSAGFLSDRYRRFHDEVSTRMLAAGHLAMLFIEADGQIAPPTLGIERPKTQRPVRHGHAGIVRGDEAADEDQHEGRRHDALRVERESGVEGGGGVHGAAGAFPGR